MRKCLYCILMLFLSLTLSHTQAQNYPVHATPLLQPPYSLDLNDYQGPASKLRLQLLLRDLTKPSLEVYISLRLSGFGVEIQTNPSVAALHTFLLQPGVPLTISGSELSPLFAQMQAQGLSYDDLLAGASLPGGYYTWEVVAYLPDGRQVSNTGRASMSVFKAQPPQITFPTHNASILASGATTIPFQWISRSVSPASVLGTIYDMKIYELPDDVTDPNVSVLSGLLPVFNTQTASTSYFYGPGDPPLQGGKRYAVVVQAQDIGGGDSYENQGLSQVVAFKVAGEPDAAVQAACPAPNGLNIRPDDAQTLEVSWNPVAEAADYLLQFRKANEPWQSQVTTDNGLMLIQLSPAKYEVQVAARCSGGIPSNISPMASYDLMTETDSTQDEVEDPISYYYEDEETPEPTEYEEPEEEDGLDILNTPFTILLDTEALPDSLKSNLPPGGSLPVLPENPSIEQLKDAVKVKKTTCAAVIADYTCGNHDAASPPSGDDYLPQPGDELAMNSIKIEVVEIDAAGNGLGIAHIKGFNNAKLGVELKGIKVKEGGCIYAGEAITNSVDLALLNEKQRAALEKAYATYTAVLDKIEENAEGVAETINGLADLLAKAKNFAKNYKGGKTEAAKAKAYEEQIKNAQKLLLSSPTVPDSLKTMLTSTQATTQAAWDFYKTGQPCEVKSNNGGGDAFFHHRFADCAGYSKLIDAEMDVIEMINDVILQKNVESILVQKVFEKIKEARKSGVNSIDLKDLFLPKYPNTYENQNSKFKLNGKNITLTNFSIGTNGNYKIDVNSYSGGKGINQEFASIGSNLTYSGTRSYIEKVYKYIIDPPNIDDEMIKKLATKIGVNDWKVLKAITMNETGGGDFFLSGGKTLPKNLFERHLYYNCISSGKIYKKGSIFPTVETFPKSKIMELTQSNPNIINPSQYLRGCKNCGGGNYAINKSDCDNKVNLKNENWFNETCYLLDEPNYYTRFVNAYEIHPECALMCTSWGAGQVMGFNIRNKYSTINEMYNDIFDNSPQGQLNKMGYFIESNKTLKNAINTKDWNVISKQYNGPSYGDYGSRLEKNYKLIK